MPSSDYSSAIGGGLKLKGAGIDKHNKKKKSKSKSKSNPTEPESATTTSEANTTDQTTQTALQNAPADEERDDQDVAKPREQEVKEYGKTEAERRLEERRKKRLEERLKREGVLTHKERVEQLNKYLSTLSEHNDMPRIGPG